MLYVVCGIGRIWYVFGICRGSFGSMAVCTVVDSVCGIDRKFTEQSALARFQKSSSYCAMHEAPVRFGRVDSLSIPMAQVLYICPRGEQSRKLAAPEGWRRESRSWGGGGRIYRRLAVEISDAINWTLGCLRRGFHGSRSSMTLHECNGYYSSLTNLYHGTIAQICSFKPQPPPRPPVRSISGSSHFRKSRQHPPRPSL